MELRWLNHFIPVLGLSWPSSNFKEVRTLQFRIQENGSWSEWKDVAEAQDYSALPVAKAL